MKQTDTECFFYLLLGHDEVQHFHAICNVICVTGDNGKSNHMAHPPCLGELNAPVDLMCTSNFWLY